MCFFGKAAGTGRTEISVYSGIMVNSLKWEVRGWVLVYQAYQVYQVLVYQASHYGWFQATSEVTEFQVRKNE